MKIIEISIAILILLCFHAGEILFAQGELYWSSNNAIKKVDLGSPEEIINDVSQNHVRYWY